jgi:hypothetical protein
MFNRVRCLRGVAFLSVSKAAYREVRQFFCDPTLKAAERLAALVWRDRRWDGDGIAKWGSRDLDASNRHKPARRFTAFKRQKGY